MFISMVAPGYTYLDKTRDTQSPIEGWIEMTEIECTGHRTMLEIGDVDRAAAWPVDGHRL